MAKNLKFEMEGYTVQIVGKNITITDTIRDYVLTKLNRIERFSKHILDIVITLDVQKLEHAVSILLKFLHFQIKSHASTDNLYSAIDKATDRIIRLIAKYKNQLEEKHNTNLGTIDLHVNVLKPQRDEVEAINTEIEAENWRRDHKAFEFHRIVNREKFLIRMLTQDEAVMKMELSGDPFLIYKEEEDQKLKVIYRREDENFGIIELEGLRS